MVLKIVDVDDGMADVILTFQNAAADIQDDLRDAADTAITQTWVQALTAKASGAQQTKLLVTGANAVIGGLDFTLIAGVGPALSGGLDASHWYAVDYGMTPKRKIAENRRKTLRIRGSGRTMNSAVLIWVGRNLPARDNAGRVIWPTIGEQSQVFVAAWVEGLTVPFQDTPMVFDTDTGDVIGQVAGPWQ